LKRQRPHDWWGFRGNAGFLVVFSLVQPTLKTHAQGHTTTYEYAADYQYAYLTSRTDMVDRQELTLSAPYDFYLGYITSKMCTCGSVTDYEYDPLKKSILNVAL
jgi:hypothetical protein